MKKIPVPVVIAVVVGAVLLLGITAFRAQDKTNGDTGNIKELANGIIQNNPKNAPRMPAGVDPTKGAMSMGRKK